MAAAEDVRVLGSWASPFPLRPRIALALKKVEYEFVVETMNPKSELLLKSNPVHKKIPVLIHNGNPVCESLVIVHYIDEAWSSGQQILPADPYDRAVARFWAAYIDDKVSASPNILSNYSTRSCASDRDLISRSWTIAAVVSGAVWDRQGEDGRGAGVVHGADAGRAAAAGGGLRDLQQGEALLRRGLRRVPGQSPQWLPALMGIAKAKTDEERASSAEQMLAGLQLLEEAFATCSKGKPFFGGDSVGYLDIALGSFLGWARTIAKMAGIQVLDDAKTPQLGAWAERFCALEAVKEVMPETEKLVEYAKMLLETRWKAAPAPAN